MIPGMVNAKQYEFWSISLNFLGKQTYNASGDRSCLSLRSESVTRATDDHVCHLLPGSDGWAKNVRCGAQGLRVARTGVAGGRPDSDRTTVDASWFVNEAHRRIAVRNFALSLCPPNHPLNI